MRIRATIFLLLLVTASFGQTVNDLSPMVTMKEYVDMVSEWQQKLTKAEIDNINDNVNKANSTMDKRLDGMNEFRDALKDSNATYITRSELIAWVVAAAGLFFGYSRYQREKEASQGKNIQSGDKVEVKK